MLRLKTMQHRIVCLLRQTRGMSIVELLIAALLSAIVAGGALDFYVTQHENLITQENVSEMQIRYNAAPLSLTVGDHTQKHQANPIHVMRFSDLTGFNVGDRVYIYRPPAGPGEWFTITNIQDNPGAGWKEIAHGGQDLINDPMAGDVILKLSEVRYWIDRTTDSLHTRLMREVNGVASIYADEVYDLQATYRKIDGTTVPQPTVGDTIVSIDYTMAARTVKRTLKIAGAGGTLTRQTNTHILLRNTPAAS
ncbi:MAG: hypothetical protein HZB43_06680 [candidate division Zixibacteria bacterium]|nr:hypothetical protein [candidate division Zixibacteria bacterium]